MNNSAPMTLEGFEEMEAWFEALLASLEPRARARLFRQIGIALRSANAKRITRQVNPDGSRWRQRRRRDEKAGRIRARKKMLLGFRKARHMKIEANADGVSLGFEGSAGRIARVHHFGLRERLKAKDRRGPLVKFSERRLLGMAVADREAIEALVLDHVTPHSKS